MIAPPTGRQASLRGATGGKLKVIVNGSESSNPGAMSVDDRQLYHEALETMFRPAVGILTSEARKIRRKKVPLIMVVVSVLVVAVYLWLHGFFG
jgi:hypothetical protein